MKIMSEMRLIRIRLFFFISILLVYSTLYAHQPFNARLSSLDLLGSKERFLNKSESLKMPAKNVVHVLAVRVEFVEDNVATTTGNGKFDLSNDSDYYVDRPPHNRTYFEQQLKALSNYFDQVSNNQLALTFDVYPKAENEAYQVGNDMVYYSGQEDEELKKQRWAELLRDAVMAASQKDTIDFNDYDSFIVFHAGVGSDFAFDFDTTPYDIQSVFIDFETLKETLGVNEENYNGIAVNDYHIKEGMILPETQNQDDQNLGLLGTMTLLMASQLGMPVLFDTETGNSGIGRWGLMDQGSYNFNGLIPAEPCAWSKIYMGWEEPVLVNNGKDIPVAISKSISTNKIYKIPISQSEYFLIENRQRDPNEDRVTYGRDEQGRRVEFDSTGTFAAEQDVGVLTHIDEYDYGLPGSGLLIWHIDETVIKANLLSNTINNDREKRGVDLVECDGAQDIGYYYDFLDPGYGAESGDYFDPYWSDNKSHKVVNDTNVVEFSSTSIPSSKAQNGAQTHIRLYNISGKDSIMTFSLISDLAVNGFPQYVGPGCYDGGLLSFNDNQNSGIISVKKNGHILGWKPDGSKLINNTDKVITSDLFGNEVEYAYALIAATEDTVFSPPSVVDLDLDGVSEIIVVDQSPKLYAFTLQDNDGDGRADILGTAELKSNITAGPMVLDPSISDDIPLVVLGDDQGRVSIYSYDNGQFQSTAYNLDLSPITGIAAAYSLEFDLVISGENGDVYAIRLDGEKVWEQTLPFLVSKYQPLVADFDGNPGVEIVIVSNTGHLASINSAGKMLYDPVFGTSMFSKPSLADIDQDGLPEILLNGKSSLSVYESSGISVTNFPKTWQQARQFMNYGCPVWMGNLAVFVGTDGFIYGLNSVGNNQGDFPLSLTEGADISPALLDVNEDSDPELFIVSRDAFLYGWNVRTTESSETAWNQYGGSKFRQFALKDTSEPVDTENTLLTPKSVFCYPNPTENNETFIRYEITRPADNVSIRIYDLAGDFVQQIYSDGASAGEHEVRWGVENIQSGVYLARIEAQDGAETNVEFIKIAVIK